MTASKRQTGAPPPGDAEAPWEGTAIVEAVRATVQAGRRRAGGVVVDSEAEHTDARVVIAFAPDQAPPLPIGRPVEVTFAGGAAGAGFEVSGRVVGRAEDQRGILYEVFFPRAANRALSPLINRRGALRVRPALDAPVAIRLRAFDGDFEQAFSAQDVSASGVSLRVSPHVELRLAAVWKVELSLTLPGDPSVHTIRGRILRRRLIGAHVYYGIHFEQQGTEAEREAILQWVLARHRVLMGRTGTSSAGARTGRQPAA